jgi:hypothetical protein
MVEESSRQMEKSWGKILGGSIIGGTVIVASPLIIRAAPAIWQALQKGSQHLEARRFPLINMAKSRSSLLSKGAASLFAVPPSFGNMRLIATQEK